MAKGKKLVDAMMSGVKTPAQMKMEMAVDRARSLQPAPAVEQAGEFRPTQAGDTVSGYVVREDIPDKSSIGASLENYKTLGLQEVPMTAFGVQGKPQYYSKQTREYTQNLAEQINQNKELNPLIVVKDKEGYYVLEGGHRFDALRELDAQSFPALVVEDLDGMARGGIIKMGKGGLGRKAADKLLPKVEAPSVMTRSEISDLADYIKNREGGYGLRRVERAADEIPRLGEMYTQDALRSAFSGDNARALMTMNPADFERYAAPLLTNLSQQSTDNIANLKAIQNVGGFSDVPFLLVNKELAGSTGLPWVTGHEGRHRSRAMEAAGVQSGLVQFLPRAELREPFPRRSQEQYIEAIRKEMELSGNKIKPEKYYLQETDEKTFQRPTIDLPDLYANGGAVKMADGGEADQAEIDRMRLELNSPVIQATPQSPLQRGIGTLGGYMDRAGQFVSKAIEPLAETHPVKHFLADMFLADTLKSAGTALQDYTKTSRDITEDQPYRRAPITGSGQTMSLDPRMLDVVGLAQPVASATTRLVGAGAKKAAPFAKDVAEMASELYTKGDIPGMIPPNLYATAPDGKPSKVLAPANEIGFYSPTEAAALNLQRKSGQGQAFLNDIMKGENVRSDEISAMGLDTFLKDKKNVTADEVRDYIAQNKIQLGESVYDSKGKPNFLEFLKQKGFPEDEALSILNKAEDGVIDNQVAPLRDEYLNLESKSTKFSDYALPGGENYREIVLTLPQSPEQVEFSRLNKKMNDDDGLLPDDMQRWTELGSKLGEEGRRPRYQSSHWDEPNPLAHLRVSDRVTDGKKTLLVDEVQSDWHQAGRERGYASQVGKKVSDEEHKIALNLQQRQRNGDALSDTEQSQLTDILDRHMASLPGMKVPDAPYKDDWYQLTLRRAIKEAIDGGYDRVALPTGSRVAERFDLSKQIDRIDYNKNDDGTYSMSAIKGGRQVFSKEGLDENELSGIVGKDVAKKMVGDEGKAQYDADIADELGIGVVKSLTGLDLKVGGEGMKKYYDEIYPGYLKKFGKKYGANVGTTYVQTEPPTDKIFRDLGKFHAYTGRGSETKEFNTYAEALEFLGMGKEPLHYMEITPAMRKEFSTGIPMRRGGKVSFANDIDAMRLELSKG